MKYVSLMGTQSLAVLNPLLSLIQKGVSPRQVTLLATPGTITRAERLKNFLVSNTPGNDVVEIIPISDSLSDDPRGYPPASTAVSGLLTRDMVFNLAGGMNFQIAACLQAIYPNQCEFVYPESVGIQAFVVADGRMVSREVLPLPDSVDVLSLQGIPFDVQPGPADPFLSKAFKTAGIQFPPDAQVHVRIGNVVFDFVWNSGNALKFIKVIKLEYNKISDDYLKAARDVIAMALNREDFGELYHRNVAILTDNYHIHERVSIEGGDKLISILYPDNESPLMAQLLKSKLNSFLNMPSPIDVNPVTTVTEKTGHVSSGDSTLYLSLGTNMMPSLIALWSHSPAHVCFVYTPGIEGIGKLKDSLLEHKQSLPVNTVSFYPAGIDGVDILNLPDPSGSGDCVNITPGTKSHTAFLTIWAQKHGLPVYSMNNRSGNYEEIPSGNSGVLTAPPPVTYLQLKGETVKSYGESKDGVLQKQDQHQALLTLFRRMNEKNISFNNFPRRHISLNDIGSEVLADEKLRIWQKERKDIVFTTTGGEWFESLIGFVMAQCGARDVQVRLRTRWSPETEKKLMEKYNKPVHRTDIDVIAGTETLYYIISCKATAKNENLVGDITTEADAFASVFGRFAVPLVCFLKYDGNPTNETNNVYVFGYKTFCDKQRMKDLLKKAVNERRKTGPVKRILL